MLDQTNDEMADAQAELTKLRAEVDRLRVQNEVAKLKAEAEKLRAEMTAVAPVPPVTAPKPAPLAAAERTPFTDSPKQSAAAPQPAPRLKTRDSGPASPQKNSPSVEPPAKTSNGKSNANGLAGTAPEQRNKPAPAAPPAKSIPPVAKAPLTPPPAVAPTVAAWAAPVVEAAVIVEVASEKLAVTELASEPGHIGSDAANAAEKSATPSPVAPVAGVPAVEGLPTKSKSPPAKVAEPPASAAKSGSDTGQKAGAPAKNADPANKPPLRIDAAEVDPSFAGRLVASMGPSFISMVTHACALLGLTFFFVPAIMEEKMEPLAATDARAPEDLTEVLSESTEASSQFTLTSSSSSGGGTGGVSGSALQSGHGGALGGGGSGPSMAGEVGEVLAAAGGGGDFNDVGLWGVSNSAMVTNVADGAPGDPGQVVNNLEEAMDRVTHEILMALLKGDVLVMWLFDKSYSMKDDQIEIRERFDRVYQELGIAPLAKGDHLVTAIGSYGKDFTLHTQKPTSNLSLIRAAIDAIPVDDSGLENQCPAVGLMINRHRKYASQGKRQLMLIMVTDESGELDDNEKNLEIAINEAKEARCPIYLLGREAVFGYPYAYMSWTEPESKLGFWVQINRGPETPYVEQLQTNGLYRRYDAHASGFGPYEQTRMARETGGVFFLLPSPEVNLVGRDNRKYELEAIKPYLPDLSPRQTAYEQRDKNELRRSLWKVIADLNPWNPTVAPHIEMAHSFSIDPQAFYQQVTAEHAKAVQYFVYLDRCEKEMERLQKLREKESSPRWRANYDLMFGQILAYKVRLYEYGAYLEAFAKNPKRIKNPYGPLRKTTHWELRDRPETLTGDKTADYIARSKKMFEYVIKDHSGTPWASRAQYELARGYGMELVEDYDDPRRVGLGVKVPKF